MLPHTNRQWVDSVDPRVRIQGKVADCDMKFKVQGFYYKWKKSDGLCDVSITAMITVQGTCQYSVKGPNLFVKVEVIGGSKDHWYDTPGAGYSV